jgi:hypothetical protein
MLSTHLNIGHRENRKSVLGKKTSFLTAVAGYRVNEDLKQDISVHAGIFRNPKMKPYRYLYLRIK